MGDLSIEASSVWIGAGQCNVDYCNRCMAMLGTLAPKTVTPTRHPWVGLQVYY